MKEKELIILAIYINIDGLSVQRAKQTIHEIISMYSQMYNDTNKNVKMYWLPVRDQQTKVECIYPPPNVIGNSKTIIENELLKIYKILSSANTKINPSLKENIKNIIKGFERKLKLINLMNKVEK